MSGFVIWQMQNVLLVGHSEYCCLFYVVCFGSGKKIICAAVAHIEGPRSTATVTVTGLLLQEPAKSIARYKLAIVRILFFNRNVCKSVDAP